MSGPLLTVVVPAFNAGGYLARALDSVTGHPGTVQVVVVDDGSVDDTATIAQQYVAALPDTFELVRQANRGHGGAINTGVRHARGRYLKVLDADDWLDTDALTRTIEVLTRLGDEGGVDALITDYVHERAGKRARETRFDSVFPPQVTFSWADTTRFSRRQFMMMHALVFRTELLRDLRLPEHTFYVDSLFVLHGLTAVRRLHYLPVPLYRYLIGRAGQSVAAEVMVRRVDQQLAVNRLALASLPSPSAVTAGHLPQPLYACLLHHVEALCAVTSATLARGGTSAHLATRARFWRELRAENPWVYARMRRSLIGTSSNLPGEAGRRVTLLAYYVARRVAGFS